MKTYIITVSTHFPAWHPRAGEETGFVDKILKGEKIHTLRLNKDYWEPIAKKVNAGEAVLSLRHWRGKPYRSKQQEFKQLTKLGIEPIKLTYTNGHDGWNLSSDINKLNLIPENDGLDSADFVHWFFDLDAPAPNIQHVEPCIIHFTDFRYGSKNTET